LKNVHEVVVRNRLEQLRKRQRDEALQAQEELLAGVAKSASRKWGAEQAVAETEVAEVEVVPEEEMEPYDRSMSPPLLDITKLPAEEREIDILTEEEDRRALVSVLLSTLLCLLMLSISLSNVVQLQPLDLCLSQHNLSKKSKIRKLPVVQTLLQRLCTELKQRKSWTKRRSSSISKRISSTQQPTTGKTSTGRGSQGISIVCIQATSGTSIIKPIMSAYLSLSRFSGPSELVISTDNPPPKVVQGYKVCFR
jgi:hypothetical protein